MSMKIHSKADAERILAQDTRVVVAGVDIDGILRGKSITLSKFLSAMQDGFGFCSVVFGWDMHDKAYTTATTVSTGQNGFADLTAWIDLDTFRRIPWDKDQVPFFLVRFQQPQSGLPLPVCPRSLLASVVNDFHNELDLEPLCAFEYEFFNFAETPRSFADKGYRDPTPITPGMFGYSLLRPLMHQDYFRDLTRQAQAFGITVEGLHTETGPGVYEAAIEYAPAIEAADRAVLFKYMAKSVGLLHGVMPSFMAKPSKSLPGCSGHVHISLKDRTTGVNACVSKNEHGTRHDATFMSGLMQHFLAGILDGLPSILPILAPTINSYKRLVENYWAPTVISWGKENRTTAIRVISPPTCPPKSTRIEVRVPGADTNAPLVLAALLACGLRGIREKMVLEPGIEGDAAKDPSLPRLSSDLKSAVDAMTAENSVARKVLGDAFVDHYAATRYHEWDAWRTEVTQWELQRYFETV